MSSLPKYESQEEIESRVKFYNSREVARYLSKHGVPKSKTAMKAFVAMGTTGNPDGDVNQELVESLAYVNFAVHPQQINVRDKANGKVIAIISR